MSFRSALTVVLSLGAFAGGGTHASLAQAVAQTVPSANANPAVSAPSPAQGSGLPVPRFVSLKSDRVHVRQGPSTDHKVLWVYQRAGLPVEVLQEFEGWRQVRDADGVVGWVLQTLISGRRTGLVLPWDHKAAEQKNAVVPQTPLLADDKDNARPIASIEAGVIANIRTCNGRWCYVSVGDFRGYIQQKKLWGVYEGEAVK